MKARGPQLLIILGAATGLGFCLLVPRLIQAHCDTLSGPVVMAARLAFEKRDVTPVLMWVQPENEPEVRAVFDQTLKVRQLGPEARELADRNFFETVVRLHRAGEGAAYSGLKPAGTDVGPAVAEADAALVSGSVETLLKKISGEITGGVRERFEVVLAKKKHADDSVQAGRDFVKAYVEFMHYVEQVHSVATGAADSHETASGAKDEGKHRH